MWGQTGWSFFLPLFAERPENHYVISPVTGLSSHGYPPNGVYPQPGYFIQKAVIIFWILRVLPLPLPSQK